MAQIVKLRRSSVSGQKPTNTNLQLGELALNTTDGKVFMAVSGSGGPSVQELLVTNTVNTGSISLTGDISGSIFTGSFKGDGSQLYNIPYSGVTGLELNKIVSGSVSASISPNRGLEINTNTTITGSISLSPAEDPDPNGLTTQATHLFVSASINQTGEDLYIRQQDNLVKWKWFEGKLNSGILWGGALSYSGDTIYITKGSGIIVNHRASATQEISPITHYVNWNNITASCQNITSSLVTYVGIDLSGSLYQQTNYFSVNQYRETIPLGMFNHTNKSTITSVGNDVVTAYDDVNQTANFIQSFGPLKIEGLSLNGQSGNLQLTIGSGQSYVYGGFYQQNPNNSSHKITAPVITPEIARVRRDGSGSFIVNNNNNGAFYTTIDPGYWDDGTGTLNTLPGGSYAIQRVFFNPFTNRVHVYYGQTTYGTKTAAFQSLSSDPFVEAPYSAHQYVFVGYIIHKGGTTDLTNSENQIVQSGLFRNTVGSGGGVGTFASLHDLDDVDILNPDNGDLLVYNSTTNLWEHSKQLTGGYTITGSLNVTGGLTGSIDYSNITNKPTLVSGSSQIELTGTTGYSTLSGSINSINSFTSSYSTGSFTGSFTGDGSGLYNIPATGVTGLQLDRIINGNVSASLANNILEVNTDTTIYGDLIVSNSLTIGNGLSDIITIKALISSSLVPDSDAIHHYVGGPSKRWEAIYSRTGSFNHLEGITGTTITISNAVASGSFTGSHIGDGSGLYNIPASGVTGLQLDKIVSGNASASIDNTGFYVNKNVYIDGTITAKELYIDYVTSSVLYQSGSTKFGDTADDNHNFTGSVYIDGSLTVDSITGSIDFNNLTNVPTLVSGSSQISYTGITDVPSGIVSSSTQISYTGITNVPNGIVSGSSQVVDLGFTTTSSFESFTSSYTTHSSSFDSRIDAITGSLNSYTSSTDSHLTTLDNFTSSVVLTNQTSSMTVLSASYALTAAFALNAGAGGSGGSSGGGFAELNQTTPSTSWTFQHNLGQKFPIFQIFDSNDEVIIPSQIIAVSSDSATITFPSAQTGRAIASLGTGPGGMTQQFSAATTWSLSHNMGTDYPIVTVYNNNRKIIFPQEIKSIDGNNIEVYFSAPVAGHLNVAKGGHIISGSVNASSINFTNTNIISGSSQISNLGYATTGSNTFNGNQTINGCLTINNAKICATGTTISSNTEIFNLSSFDGAFFDYVVKNGSNMRAGSIMSAWDGTNSTYNETTTIDLGNTNAVGFNVSGTGRLNATISSGTWTVEVLYRALGGSIVTPAPTSTPAPTPTPTSTPTPTATPTVTSTSGTNFLISSGSTAPDYCSGLFGTYQTVYGNASDWLAITRFYTNSSMTTPFNGYDKYYGNSTADYGTTLQIDTQGYVIGNYAC